MRIGIFGGTFNPPHLGHKKLAYEIMRLASLDKILVIPDNVPPHKLSSDLLSGEQRFEMCVRTFYEDVFDVTDIELKREGKSYSVFTIEELKQIYPDDDLFLIIGSDMVLSFHKWYRYEDILSMCTLCVMTRESIVSSDDLSKYAEEVLHLKRNEIYVSKSEAFEVSSTQIKKMIRNKEDICHLLEERTYEYIKENNLYL